MGLLQNLTGALPIGGGKLRATLGMKPKEGGLFSGMKAGVENMTDSIDFFAKAKFWVFAALGTLAAIIFLPPLIRATTR